MNELTNIIVQQTVISEENAQKSVQVTLGFLKTNFRLHSRHSWIHSLLRIPFNPFRRQSLS